MSTHEKVARLLNYAPHPADGYHLEAHIEPDVLAALQREKSPGNYLFRVTGRPLVERPGQLWIESVLLVEDPSAVFAEFHIVPDRFRPGGVFERVERWRRAHA